MPRRGAAGKAGEPHYRNRTIDGSPQPSNHRSVRALSSKVWVLIVDDSFACRRVVRELLERRGYGIAGEADCAAMALDLVERLAPDAVLLDVRLRDANGFDVAARLTTAYPELAVLLTSIDFGYDVDARANVSRARGFVPKSELAQVELAAFWPAPGGP